MRVLDAGHKYALRHLDGDGEEILTFVKREGEGYPGNVGHYEGTTLQETLRALIDRGIYVDRQISDDDTREAIHHMKMAVYHLELRAARRHNRFVDFDVHKAVFGETCRKCGHVGCVGQCHAALASRTSDGAAKQGGE